MSVSLPLHRQAHDRARPFGRLLFATGVAAGSLVHGSVAHAWHGTSERRELVDRLSPCLASRPLFDAYGWPVRPFDRPHPVRGNFGDPRTSFFGSLRGGPAAPGIFLFHNGVDISAPDGTAVYPVVSGRVTDVEADHVTVTTSDLRRFQYWHIDPEVVVGEAVTSDTTILGHILPRLGHVHLTEIDRGRVVNPLLPGHLFPYRDSRPPRVDNVIVTGNGRTLPGPTVGDWITIDAAAHDLPSVAPPGHWRDAVVTPATLSWWLSAADGSTVRGPSTVFDVRHTIPHAREFWHVYSSGTFQNFPVSARRHLTSIVGNYVFRLAELNTESLANGVYTLTVEATDICGNAGTLRTTIRVANPPEGSPARDRDA